MKLISLKTSKSGKNQVLGLLSDVEVQTPMGIMRRTRIYNAIIKETDLVVGDEVDINLNDFEVEVHDYTNPETGEITRSYWLR